VNVRLVLASAKKSVYKPVRSLPGAAVSGSRNVFSYRDVYDGIGSRFWGRSKETGMAVPRKKVSRMKRGFRRSADALKAPTYVEDKESGERRRPHHIDLKTGKYRGRQILEPQNEV